MFRSGALLVLCLSTASAQQPTIPDTPVGRTFKAWFDAFNSGDRNLVAAYTQKYEPSRSADEIMGFRGMTGGFDLTQITKAARTHLEAMLKDRARGGLAYASLDVTDANPAVVTSLTLHPLPPGTTAANIDPTIDVATRAKVIDSAIADLNAFYVVPALAKQMSEALRAHQKHGEYDAISDGSKFADMLTANLQGVSHDKHLRVVFSPVPLPPIDTSHGNNPIKAQFRQQMQRSNCAFDKAEMLPGNIGYIKFDGFAPPDICAPTATAALNFVAHADAIIFDLRENHGGDPAMVQFICSYLFDEPTHLNDLWTRRDSSTKQYWTLSYVPGERSPDKPVYVLTSHETFSGGEEFTYDLKNLKRAMIIGETTGGGAHPVAGHRIDGRFQIGVPFATAVSPVTHTSWEGTGVLPDIKVPADSALAVAEKMAADTLRATRQ